MCISGSPEREGALPVRRRDSPPVRSIVCPCRTKAASSRGHPSSPPDGVPQERDPDAALVRLPGRPSLPARQQDGSPNRLAIRPGTEGPRRDRANRQVGLPGAPDRRAVGWKLAGPFLVCDPRRGGPARRSSSRSSPYPCQHRLAAGRNRPRHCTASRAPQCGNDPQIHPSRRRHGAGRSRDRRRHSGTGHSTTPLRCVERQLFRVTHPFHPLHGREFELGKV